MLVLVTGQTGSRDRQIANGVSFPGWENRFFPFMTVVAGDVRVSFFQFEMRISIVLKQERDDTETQCGMTGIAMAEKLTAMHILMAPSAFL